MTIPTVSIIAAASSVSVSPLEAASYIGTMLKPEIIVPIVLNLVLAIATVLYLLETRSARKTMLKQFEISERQHFVNTAPFLYAGTIRKDDSSTDLTLSIVNPSDKLARDVSYIIYELNKKTFRFPQSRQGVIKRDQMPSVTIDEKPFTAQEVIGRLESFYGIENSIAKQLTEMEESSYVVLIYTDIEGAVYSVKANFKWKDDGKFARSRSIFKRISKPRNSIF
jgi:hypothetical protein